MRSHTEAEIRKSFLNCSKGAAQRINLPKDLPELDWEAEIFLGWIDPKSPQSAYIVVEVEDQLRGVALTKGTQKARGGAQMCQFCLTLHPASGVSLYSIQRGKSQKDAYNTIGTYLCFDLRCSDYTQGGKKPEGIRQMDETLTLEQRCARTAENVAGLVQRVAQR